MTLEAWLYQWVNMRSGGLRPRTVESYTTLIRLHIAPTIGHRKLKKLKPEQIASMLADIVANGHTRTAELCFVLLRAALRAAVVHQRLERSPVDAVLRPAHTPMRGKVWTPDETRAFLKAIENHRYRIVWLLALCMGLRRGEICGLRWSDVDLQGRILHVHNQRVKLADGRLIDALPKSRAGIRDLPIPLPLLPVFRRQFQFGGGYVVPLTPSGLDTLHRATLRRLALPYIRLHDLRHTMATNALRNGAGMRALADVLGHSDPAVTARFYTHPDAGMLACTIDAATAIMV